MVVSDKLFNFSTIVFKLNLLLTNYGDKMSTEEIVETKQLTVINENKKEIMIWQIVGAVVIFGIGAVWHFMFEWIGEWAPIGWLFPVNESVWEHVKLMYWPAIIYFVIEGIFLWKKTNNFLLAKLTVLYFTPIANIVFFYTYTGVTGYENFIIDSIVLFIIICIQQYISYRFLTSVEYGSNHRTTVIVLSAIGIGLLGVILILFTYIPPHIPLFEDTNFNDYGIF